MYDDAKKQTPTKGRPGFAFNDADDTEILRLVYEYRFLRLEHLNKLTGRSLKTLARRLLQLVRAGYLTPLPKFPQQKHIYGVGPEAVAVLVEKGIASPELAEKRSRVHELKEMYLKHEMMIVEIHITLELAARGSSIRLVAWKEGKALHDRVVIQEGSRKFRLPVGPDAFFTLEDSRRPVGNNRRHFFLEADRTSANHTRFRDKIRAYYHYRNQKLCEKKHGIKSFKMLTVAKSDERARNLTRDAQRVLPEGDGSRKQFLYTSLEAFSIENPRPILEDVHYQPRDLNVRFTLMSPLAEGSVGSAAEQV